MRDLHRQCLRLQPAILASTECQQVKSDTGERCSNTGIFRRVAYGYQNGLGRHATFVFQSSFSLVSASSRSNDVFPEAPFDLTRGLRGEGLGSTKNFPSASEIFEACRDRLGDSRFTTGTPVQGCGLLQADASESFVGLSPTSELRAVRAATYFR